MQRRRAIDVQLATLVREAVAEGRLRSDIDPDTISRASSSAWSTLSSTGTAPTAPSTRRRWPTSSPRCSSTGCTALGIDPAGHL